MPDPYLLVTGFGPFEKVSHNASGDLAKRLDGRPGIVARELPTAYRGAADEIDALIEGASIPPAGFLALGVHRSAYFRLEEYCSSRPPSERTDIWGETRGLGPRLPARTPFDLEACQRACEPATELPVRISGDAGGYVCDATFEHVLRRGSELGFPGLFLHVPPLAHLSVEEQEPVLLALIEELWRQIGSQKSLGR